MDHFLKLILRLKKRVISLKIRLDLIGDFAKQLTKINLLFRVKFFI